MEEQGNQSYWPSLPLDGGGSSSQTVCMGEGLQNQCSNFSNAGNESPHHHATLPRCTCQQTPQNNFDFLSQSGGTYETRKEAQLGDAPMVPGFTSNALSYDKVGANHQMPFQGPSNEGSTVFDVSGSEFQATSLNLSEGHSPAGSYKTARYKEKATEADRRRRHRISNGLDALQELLPNPTKRTAIIDNVGDRIKHLQLQIKELSHRRLGAGSPSTPLVFVEGFGHYLVHDQAVAEPVEEMVRKLFELNPSAATQLLESRGLYIKPMSFADMLSSQT